MMVVESTSSNDDWKFGYRCLLQLSIIFAN